MKITTKWLKEKSACEDGCAWFMAQKKRGAIPVLRALMDDKKLQWANWLIVRVMDKPQRVRYAIFAAEEVIGIFEKKHPNDQRPRKAIEAAKAWIKNPTDKNRAYAAYAAYDADAAYAAYAAYAADAAYAAAVYADAAAYAAAYAAYAAYADAAAYAAYDAAAYAADAADANAAYAADANAMRMKILEYGIGLLKKGMD